VLEAAYQENSQWNYDKKTELAIQLNMTFAQVTKWNWDRKQRDLRQEKRNQEKAERAASGLPPKKRERKKQNWSS